jgi:hypothetical protein
MGDLLGPSGLLKASLNEPKQQQMHQSIKCYVIGEMLSAQRVSKPSNFLASYLLNFSSSTTHIYRHPSSTYYLLPTTYYLPPFYPPQKLLFRDCFFTLYLVLLRFNDDHICKKVQHLSILIKSFCGVQGRFFQKEPLAAGGKEVT